MPDKFTQEKKEKVIGVLINRSKAYNLKFDTESDQNTVNHIIRWVVTEIFNSVNRIHSNKKDKFEA